MIRFAPFLRLDVRHDYHGDVPPPLVLEPDAATARLAARADLRLRLADGTAELFTSDDRTALAALAADGALALTFRLRSRTPSLAAVTVALAEARGRIPVLESGDRPEGPLHADPTVADADLRPLVPGEIVTQADVARPPFAILRITPDPDARGVAFQVRFGAVERLWTYHVIGGAPDAAYTVRDRTGALSFQPLGLRVMSNGALAQSFRSRAPIAERARPADRFELVSEGPFGPRVVMPTLPAPRPGPGTPDPAGAPAVSEIFVNLW